MPAASRPSMTTCEKYDDDDDEKEEEEVEFFFLCFFPSFDRRDFAQSCVFPTLSRIYLSSLRSSAFKEQRTTRGRKTHIQRATGTRKRWRRLDADDVAAVSPPFFHQNPINRFGLLTLISLVPKRLSRILRKLIPMLGRGSELSCCCCCCCWDARWREQ